MKASFFRDILNYERLHECSLRYKGIVAEYYVIQKVFLDDREFSAFCNEFRFGCKYLMPYIDSAIISKGIWKCVSITNASLEVLIVMNHYQYPRYLAIRNEE